MPMLLPALKKALKMGLNYQPAAELSMDVLDSWLQTKGEALVPLLPELLPFLSSYLTVGQHSMSGALVAAAAASEGEDVGAVGIPLDIGMRVVLSVIGDPVEGAALDRHRSEDRK